MGRTFQRLLALLHDGDLVLGQAVELVDDLIDQPVSGRDASDQVRGLKAGTAVPLLLAQGVAGARSSLCLSLLLTKGRAWLETCEF